MFRITVRDRIAKDLPGRLERTFGYIQGATILDVRNHFHDLRGLDLVDRACANGWQDVSIHASFNSVDMTLALAVTPMTQPEHGNGLEGLFARDVDFVFLGHSFSHGVRASR